MPHPISIGAFRDKQTQRVKALEEALYDLESLVSRSQEIVAHHIDPASAVTSEEAISELVELFSAPDQQRIEADVRRLLANRGR